MAPTSDTTIEQQQHTKSTKSWFSGLFSHWHPLHKWSHSSTSSGTPTTQLSTATSTTKSQNNNATLAPPPSSTSSSASSTYENNTNHNNNTINTTSLQITVSPSSSSSRYPPGTAPWQWEDRQGLLFSERRQSQQTIGSILSDDQFSSSSCHGRNSEEKSRLGDLWSKARKRHPHYPRFRWPHRKQQSSSHPLHPHHRRAIPISIYSTPPQEERPTLATSYQDPRPRRPSSLLPSSTPPSMMLKRHSITSLVSGAGDPSYYTNSRPGSVMYAGTTASQPESPRILFMKDGQLWDDEDNDDLDLDTLDIHGGKLPPSLPPPHLHRWSLNHDLLKLALNGLIGCPLEENGGPSDKQVLQIGCGDGTWCVDVAMANPRWTVIGMEENGYDHSYTTSVPVDTNESYCHHHHHHHQQQQQPCFGGLSGSHNNMFKPKNMRLIRCAPSLLHALQQMPDHVFDLVDGRCLILAYTLDMYRQLVKECWRVCKIGGYVELIEMDMRMYHSKTPITMGKTVHTLNSEVIHMMESRSLDPRLARRLPDLLEEVIDAASSSSATSLTDSTSTASSPPATTSNNINAGYTSLPVGVWGGRLGVMFREDVHTLMESVQVWVSQYKDSDCRSDKDLENELDEMDNEMELQRSFMNLHHCYAQKTY